MKNQGKIPILFLSEAFIDQRVISGSIEKIATVRKRQSSNPNLKRCLQKTNIDPAVMGVGQKISEAGNCLAFDVYAKKYAFPMKLYYHKNAKKTRLVLC